MSAALVLPGVEAGLWQRRDKSDAAALALGDRHYSRRRPGSNQLGPPGRKLILVTPCERAVWLSHWPDPNKTLDQLDAWRCSIFRNEGAGLSSALIRSAMETTLQLWGRLGPGPADGWVTWVDVDEVGSANPGYCFKQAGWWLDRTYRADRRRPSIVRLRAAVGESLEAAA